MIWFGLFVAKIYEMKFKLKLKVVQRFDSETFPLKYMWKFYSNKQCDSRKMIVNEKKNKKFERHLSC